MDERKTTRLAYNLNTSYLLQSVQAKTHIAQKKSRARKKEIGATVILDEGLLEIELQKKMTDKHDCENRHKSSIVFDYCSVFGD